MSSQLKGLTAEVGQTPKSENAEPETSEDSTAGSPMETEREEDWGIEAPKSGMSRETKIGFAFVFILLVVFGFVVYKKVEHNRAEKGGLLAGVDKNAAQNAAPEESASQTGDAQNPIADAPPPPAQNADPFAGQIPDEPTPAELNPIEPTPAKPPAASWDEPAFEPEPSQNPSQSPPVAGSPPPSNAEGSTSIDQFPMDGETEITAQAKPQNAAPFPQEVQTGPAESFAQAPPTQTTTVAADSNTEGNDFAPAATPETEDQLAQGPVPQEFAAPTEIAPKNPPPELTQSAPEATSPASEAPDNAKADFNPIGIGEGAAGPDAGQAPPESQNEQFSAQSQPVPEPTEAAPPAKGHPFGETADSEKEKAAPPAGDPFGLPAPGTKAETKTETATSEFPKNAGESFGPIPTEEEPERLPESDETPMKLSQPESTRMENAAPIEVPAAEEAGREDFPEFPEESPKKTIDAGGTTTVGSPERSGTSLSPEFPKEPVPQLPKTEDSKTQDSSEFTEAPALVPKEDESDVYVVRPGDNYWKISKKQYGTVRYFSALARYNQKRIADPKTMRPGMKVLTPSRKVLEAKNPDLFPKFSSGPGEVANVGHQADQQAGFFMNAQGKPMYRVGQDDTLGGIAQKHLGRFSRWVEIYRLNRQRLKDPDALTIGDVLKLPADASRVNMVRHASGIR